MAEWVDLVTLHEHNASRRQDGAREDTDSRDLLYRASPDLPPSLSEPLSGCGVHICARGLSHQSTVPIPGKSEVLAQSETPHSDVHVLFISYVEFTSNACFEIIITPATRCYARPAKLQSKRSCSQGHEADKGL